VIEFDIFLISNIILRIYKVI